MPDDLTTADSGYQHLLERISSAYTAGQVRAIQVVNVQLTETYWGIGRDIVAYEQGGKATAAYGQVLLERLATDLSCRHGKGFSRSNLSRFRQFYLSYPICATVSHKLSWSVITERQEVEAAVTNPSGEAIP